MRLGIERLRRIMDDEQRGMLIDVHAERIAEAAYQQGVRDATGRCHAIVSAPHWKQAVRSEMASRAAAVLALGNEVGG